MVLTAMELATSPAACPPMPSHTANSGACTRKESSLCPRTRPTSERDPHARVALTPWTVSAPARPSTAISARPGALAGSWAEVLFSSSELIRGSPS